MCDSFNCHQCDGRLDYVPPLASGEKTAGSDCGSTTPDLDVEASETISVQDRAALVGEREGSRIGFRESARQGRVTSADRHDDGSFSHLISGPSPQGEQDTLQACRVLIAALNALGENWGEPVKCEGVVDCQAFDLAVPSRKLSVQVVKAIVDPNFWKELDTRGSLEDSGVSREHLVARIKEAIEYKANDLKIPRPGRRGLTLALDANRLPVLCLDDVVEEFRTRFGAWAQSLGFEAVWLIGPQDSLTWRLDIEP